MKKTKTMILVFDVSINLEDSRSIVENIDLCETKEHLEKYLKNNNVTEDKYQLYTLQEFVEAFNNERINEAESYINYTEFK